MRPANIAIPILTMIGSVGLFVLVGYFAFQSTSDNNPNTPILTTNVATNASLTANWVKHTSAALGFSAEFPSKWVATECGDTYVGFDAQEFRCESEYETGFNVKTIDPDTIQGSIDRIVTV